MWELDIKNAEHRRINSFELRCWRRLLRVPWTARRSNQSILKEISPECSLEGLMLKLKLQYFGHLIQRSDSLEKTLILGKIEGRRRGRQKWDSWEKRWDRWDSDGITDSMDMRLSRLWETVRTGRTGVLQSMGSQRVRHDWVTEQQRQQHKLWSCNTEFPGNHHLLLARHYSAHVNCIVFFLTLFISST